MNWIVMDEDYLNYLRQFESRIPFSDYGSNHFKPFFGKLFSHDGITYVTAISHKQPRHDKMKNSVDFRKVYIPGKRAGEPNQFVAVINLNYMFPIRDELITYLQYSKIDECRTFSSEKEKSQYIDLLRQEMISINQMKVDEKAKKLYEIKMTHPENPISMRCFDYELLEGLAKKYEKE